jgi:hypothetical protein
MAGIISSSSGPRDIQLAVKLEFWWYGKHHCSPESRRCAMDSIGLRSSYSEIIGGS